MTNLNDHIKHQQEVNRGKFDVDSEDTHDINGEIGYRMAEYADQLTADTIKKTLEWVREEVKRVLLIQQSGVRPDSKFEEGYTTAYKNMYHFITQLEDSKK